MIAAEPCVSSVINKKRDNLLPAGDHPERTGSFQERW